MESRSFEKQAYQRSQRKASGNFTTSTSRWRRHWRRRRRRRQRRRPAIFFGSPNIWTSRYTSSTGTPLLRGDYHVWRSNVDMEFDMEFTVKFGFEYWCDTRPQSRCWIWGSIKCNVNSMSSSIQHRAWRRIRHWLQNTIWCLRKSRTCSYQTNMLVSMKVAHFFDNRKCTFIIKINLYRFADLVEALRGSKASRLGGFTV